MSEHRHSSAGSVGLSGLLTLLLVYLKLTNQIDWAWVWVLSPLWIPLGLLALIGIPVILFAARQR